MCARGESPLLSKGRRPSTTTQNMPAHRRDKNRVKFVISRSNIKEDLVLVSRILTPLSPTSTSSSSVSQHRRHAIEKRKTKTGKEGMCLLFTDKHSRIIASSPRAIRDGWEYGVAKS